jgi:hypothetical protein
LLVGLGVFVVNDMFESHLLTLAFNHCEQFRAHK